MKRIIYFFIGLAITLSSCDSDNTVKDHFDYNSKLNSIHSYEMANPNLFLSSEGKYSQSFWGNEFNVDCEITNSSKLTGFKDIVLKVVYYSQTNSIIGTENYIIYETFKANSKKTVNIKINNYKDVSSLGLEVVSATGIFETFY
jgi:hypothetical protein